MNNEKEKWISDALASVRGIEHVQPNGELFSKIEKRLSIGGAKIISLNGLRVSACAGLLLLLINVLVLLNYSKASMDYEQTHTAKDMSTLIMSNYKIYD